MNFKKLIAAVAVFSAATPFFGAACSNGESNADDPVPTCEHQLSRISRTEPTCVSEGNIAHYRCTVCGERFFDEKATIALSAENVAIAKVEHTVEYYAAGESVAEYRRCIACEKYFTDAALTQEITYRQLYMDYYHPIKLADVATGDIFNSSSALSPLYDDFTFRCFIGWTNADNKTYGEMPENDRVQVNINFNRIGAGSRVDWYNFGVGYGKGIGLFYKPVESGDSVMASADLTQLFLEQGGIYVVVVRQGASITAYFEDAEGNLRLFTSGKNFGESEAVERLAANQAIGIDGWTPSVTKTAVCVGIADRKCVFDKAYE